MSALSEVPVYWLNFALHIALVSGFAWFLCRLVRDPGKKAFAAVVGAIAIVVVPWVTAMRPFSASSRSEVPGDLSSAEKAWPEWMIRIEDQESPVSTVDSAVSSERIGRKLPLDWAGAIALVWMMGSFLALAVWLVRQAKLVQWSGSLRPTTDEEWSVIREVHDGERKRLKICDRSVSPCAVGFFRLRMVVPGFLLSAGQERKLAWALRHEAEHLRGGDPRLAVLLSLARAIVWWNPVVHSLCGIWTENREKVCDASAIGEAKDHAAYGEFLLDLSSGDFEIAVGAVPMSMSRGGRQLRKRLQAMVRGDRVVGNSLPFRLSTALVIVGSGVLICCAGVSKDIVVPGESATSAVSFEKPKKESQPAGGLPTRAVQIKISPRLIVTKAPVPEAGSVLSDREFELVMRRLASTVGADLMTTPSVVAKDRRNCEIMMIRTAPGHPTPEDVREVPFVGLSLRMLPQIRGKELSLSVDCMINGLPDESPLQRWSNNGMTNPPGKNFDWSRVRSATAKSTKTLSAGDVMVVDFKGVGNGEHLTGFFIAEPIDATGRATSDFGVRIDDPYAIVLDASFRIRAGILEIPKEEFAENYVPFESIREARERAEKSKDAKWEDLKTVTVRSGKSTEPWKEYPGFKLTVISFAGGASTLESVYPSGAGTGTVLVGGGQAHISGHLLGRVLTMEYLPRTAGKTRKLLVMVIDKED